MSIFDIFTGRNKVRNTYIGDRDNFVSRWARPPSKNTAEWLAMFGKSPRLAVVERIANDISNVQGHLYYVEQDGTETEVNSHPFLSFMSNPNPLYEMTSPAIWRLSELYLMLVGESFILIERDENQRPIEMWNVPPHWVKMTPYLGHPYYDIVSPSGITMSVLVDDMFVMKQLNPLDPFMRGLGSAESVADEVEIDEYAAKFQKRFFYNDATPPLIFMMPDTATEEQRKAFMARWNKQHRGVENSHKAAAVSGAFDVKVLGSTDTKNLGFLESRIAMRDAVLEHFGVPREIMGITENSNRATADAAQYIYAKNVLMPRIRNREEAINKQLLPLFGDNLVWRFDAVVPYDKEFDKAKALDAYNSGLITKNEARAMLDFPEIDGDGGNVFKAASNDVFLNVNDNPAEMEQIAVQTNSPTPDLKSAQRRSMNIADMLRRKSKAVRKYEQLFHTAITRHFADQKNQIEKILGHEKKASEPTDFINMDLEEWLMLDDEERTRIAEELAESLLHWDIEAENLTIQFQPLWTQAYLAGMKISEDAYKLSHSIRPDFSSAARLNGAKRVVGIEDTTKQSIAKIIADGFNNGDRFEVLTQEILSKMDTTEKRAWLIARQETMTAIASGEFDKMLEAGAATKTWHHMDPQPNPRDGIHCKVNHVRLEGETVPIEETFSNGLRYPCDPEDGRPEEVINCHCYLTYAGFRF